MIQYKLLIKKEGEIIYRDLGIFNSIEEAVTKVRWEMLNGVSLSGVEIRRVENDGNSF